MGLFSDPTSVLMALLALITCFSMSIGGTYLILRKSGLWSKMQEEIRAQRIANDEKEKTSC